MNHYSVTSLYPLHPFSLVSLLHSLTCRLFCFRNHGGLKTRLMEHFCNLAPSLPPVISSPRQPPFVPSCTCSAVAPCCAELCYSTCCAELITPGLLGKLFCSQNMCPMAGLGWVDTPLILNLFTNGLSQVASPIIYLQNFSAILRLNTYPPTPPMTSYLLNVFMAFATMSAFFGSPTPGFLYFLSFCP